MMETAIGHYWDSEGGGFYFTADDPEALLVRCKTVQDGATPSANSTMLGNLAKLATLLDRADYRAKADAILGVFGGEAAQRPFQSERLLAYGEAAVEGMQEVVLVGAPEDEATQALLREVYGQYRPNKLVARLDPSAEKPATPLYQGRTLQDGKPAAYVCRNFVCNRPTTDPAELRAQLV